MPRSFTGYQQTSEQDELSCKTGGKTRGRQCAPPTTSPLAPPHVCSGSKSGSRGAGRDSKRTPVRGVKGGRPPHGSRDSTPKTSSPCLPPSSTASSHRTESAIAHQAINTIPMPAAAGPSSQPAGLPPRAAQQVARTRPEYWIDFEIPTRQSRNRLYYFHLSVKLGERPPCMSE